MKKLVLGVVFAIVTVAHAETKPKYGPAALPLSNDASYFRHSGAPDFWALIPYYVPQVEGWSCSVASVQMLVNAARAAKLGVRTLTSDDELATHKVLLEKVKHEAWKAARGVTLDQLGEIAVEALKAYGLKAKAEVLHPADAGPAELKKLRAALEKNEKSTKDFILLNFNQGSYTGDAEVGHIAPLAAYDKKMHRALVLDPDRTWYEPYWVSDEDLLKGMATKDTTAGKTRGWVIVTLE